MPTILHVRNLSDDTIRRINVKARDVGITRSEWVRQTLDYAARQRDNLFKTADLFPIDNPGPAKDYVEIKPPARKIGGWSEEDKVLLEVWADLIRPNAPGFKPKKMVHDLAVLRSARAHGFTNSEITYCIQNWNKHPYLRDVNRVPSISRIMAKGMLPEWQNLLLDAVKSKSVIDVVVDDDGTEWELYADGTSKKVVK